MEVIKINRYLFYYIRCNICENINAPRTVSKDQLNEITKKAIECVKNGNKSFMYF